MEIGFKMAKQRKITDTIDLLLNRHDNAEATAAALQNWTTEKRDFYLSKLELMEKSIDNGNHEAYRIAFNQLKEALKAQKDTLDKVHSMLLFESNN